MIGETMYLCPRFFRARENESERARWDRCIGMLAEELRRANADQFYTRIDYLTSIASGYAMGTDGNRLAVEIRKMIRR